MIYKIMNSTTLGLDATLKRTRLMIYKCPLINNSITPLTFHSKILHVDTI